MAPSFDCFSSLLCTEDINIFDEIDDPMDMSEEEPLNPIDDQIQFHNQNHHIADPIEWLPPLLSDECLAHLLKNECHHLPGADYAPRLKKGDLDFAGRLEAIDWIEKVKEYFGFGPLCVYLSINYLDRFLSDYAVPKQNWTMQLLAVSCLSLAAKLEETVIPQSLDLQVGATKFVFEPKTIQRMELMIMNTLKWRMQAITPFSFIDYFLYKVNDDQVPLAASFFQSSQLILKIQKEIGFLEFKPSEISAAVAISVVGETKTIQSENEASALIQLVEKEKVLKCVKMIQLLSSGSDAVAAAAMDTTSPLGVLDAVSLSFKSDETTNANPNPNANANANANENENANANANNNSPDAKRMKPNF